MNLKESSVKYHFEKIECPNCHSIELAKVEHTEPWWSYVHECKKCDYLIGESEWDKVEEL